MQNARFDAISAHIADPRRYRHCRVCDTAGAMVQRNGGYAVICPNPACPAPAQPFDEVCPTRQAAADYWKDLQHSQRSRR